MSSSSSDTTTTTTTKILSNVNTPNKHNPLAHHQGDLIIINRASFSGGGGHCSNSAFLTMHQHPQQSANKKGIRTRSTKTNNITMSKQTTFFCNGAGGHIRAMMISTVAVVLAVTILPRPLGVDCQLQAPSLPVDSSDYSGNDSVRLFLEAYEPWLN